MITNQAKTARQKLILAAIGMTKSGKTTSISALSAHPEQIMSMSRGDDGRTKVTVEYHFVEKVIGNGLSIENIEFYEQSILTSPDGSSKDSYNAAVRDNPKIYKNILKLREVADDEPLRESVLSQLTTLKDKITTPDDIKALITTETIDSYVKKITLRVQMSNDLKSCLSDVDLYIRDTRGLMDIAVETNSDGTKKLANVRPLSEIGLDRVHGVVFFSSDDYPNIVSSIYEDTIKAVFSSVPVFLVARDKALSKFFRLNNQPETLDNVKSFICKVQNGTSDNYPDVEAEFFQDTLRLLEKFKITENVGNDSYQFLAPYFKQSETEFLFSFCTILKKSLCIADIIAHPDFKFYQLTVAASFNQMIMMVRGLLESMYQVLRSGIAGNILLSNYAGFVRNLQNDLQKYDNYYTSINATRIFKPQLTYLTQDDFGNNLVNPNYNILGPYGGITTQDHGRLRYASTAVLSVAARTGIDMLINSIELTSDLADKNGIIIMNNLAGDYKKQEALLKKTLRYVLYHQFTDIHAAVQYYVIIDRHEAKNAISSIRQRNVMPVDAAVESFRTILNSFCSKLQNIGDIEPLFINR